MAIRNFLRFRLLESYKIRTKLKYELIERKRGRSYDLK